MSTNAHIGIKNQDGSIDYIYSHWDGYPSYVGEILKTAYNTPEKVRELIELGDVSILTDKLHPDTENHSFSTPEDGVCVFYGRDRGEDGVGVDTKYSENGYYQTKYIPFKYLFVDGEWMVNGNKL